MNGDSPQALAPIADFDKERMKHIPSIAHLTATSMAGLTVLFTTAFSIALMVISPVWPATVAVVAMCGMTATVCYFMLRQK